MSVQGTECAQFAASWLHGSARSLSARMLDAYAARRAHLTAKVRAENPSFTELEIEARAWSSLARERPCAPAKQSVVARHSLGSDTDILLCDPKSRIQTYQQLRTIIASSNFSVRSNTEVSIPRQSRGLYLSEPLKAALRGPVTCTQVR